MSCKYPLSMEDFAALVWEDMEHEYPCETEKIDLLEAIHALKFEVSELVFQDKLPQHDWVSTHDGGWIPRFKAIET